MGQQAHQAVIMAAQLIAPTIQQTQGVQIVRQTVLKAVRQNAITIVPRHVSITAMGVAMIHVAVDAHTLAQVQGVQDVRRHVH